MNKAELIDELAGRLDGNRRAAGHALESVLDVIQRSLVKGEKVVITGFGSFEAVARGARTARNPRTGATVKVKKTVVPKFKAGADLKAVVSGAKKLPKVATSAAPAAKKAPAKKAPAKKAPAKKAPAKKASAKKVTQK